MVALRALQVELCPPDFNYTDAGHGTLTAKMAPPRRCAGAPDLHATVSFRGPLGWCCSTARGMFHGRSGDGARCPQLEDQLQKGCSLEGVGNQKPRFRVAHSALALHGRARAEVAGPSRNEHSG